MSKAEAVAQHLPYLRRYARALTGSQTSGDAYVAATLEALVKDPSLIESSYPPRVTLYRLFSTIWNSLAVNDNAEQVTNLVAAERHLNQITAKPRQAFLLISVEGFSEEHAAYILDVDAPTLRKLVEESGRELAAQIATDVLIIEDEALIALGLESLVENLGHKVVGVARTRTEAATIARKRRPGTDPRRHPARRRQLWPRCRQRPPQLVRGAGDLHHRLSRALFDWRSAGARISGVQALSAGDAFGPDKPSPVLRTQRGSTAEAGELSQAILVPRLIQAVRPAVGAKSD